MGEPLAPVERKPSGSARDETLCTVETVGVVVSLAAGLHSGGARPRAPVKHARSPRHATKPHVPWALCTLDTGGCSDRHSRQSVQSGKTSCTYQPDAQPRSARQNPMYRENSGRGGAPQGPSFRLGDGMGRMRGRDEARPHALVANGADGQRQHATFTLFEAVAFFAVPFRFAPPPQRFPISNKLAPVRKNSPRP
jgi:hypothetical protein